MTSTPQPRAVVNLNAGPSALPPAVLAKAAQAVVDLDNSGLSILCISHRSPAFDAIVAQANANLAHLLSIPTSDFSILWIQGGASTQFHAVVANLAARARGLGAPQDWVADYLVTGTWSEKAVEAANAAGIKTNVVWTGKPNKYTSVAPVSQWQRSPNRLYTYVCTNETIHGVELNDAILRDAATAATTEDPSHFRPLLVADMSSNILSRPVDINLYDIIFAGAQKNMGPAGVTIALVRNSLLAVQPDQAQFPLPLMIDYATYAKSNSMYNTPPVYAMYVTGLVLDWLKEHGGIAWIHDQNQVKADAVYKALEEAKHFTPVVAQADVRSRMNVVFQVVDDEGKPQEALNKKFTQFAEKRGVVGLPGHRSVGGCRASLYNAVTVEEAQVLVECIREFDRLL
ncbi:phosphoserine aminotransferase [Catenaria anguillulae PL171]|uniref:phosphoserine transaminase n=1 Tax=Catenaria anguillulae PL171 TaxID=765915 RepID=A0A1Y2I2Y9_9FUNG|nr:phosphoserine aminotransferase [Catenaria anguillulae PL171]